MDQSAIIADGMINMANKNKRQLLNNPVTAPPAPHIPQNNATINANATTFLTSFYGGANGNNIS